MQFGCKNECRVIICIQYSYVPCCLTSLLTVYTKKFYIHRDINMDLICILDLFLNVVFPEPAVPDDGV